MKGTINYLTFYMEECKRYDGHCNRCHLFDDCPSRSEKPLTWDKSTVLSMATAPERVKPTKAQFRDYVRIQHSGNTNMNAINVVCEESCEGLTRELCKYIMSHYDELMQEYKIEINDALLEAL